MKKFSEFRGYNLPDQFFADMAWKGRTNGDSEAYNMLTDKEKQRILDSIMVEQYGVERGGVKQRGKKAGC